MKRGSGGPGGSGRASASPHSAGRRAAAAQPLAAICGLDDPVRRRLYDYVAGRPDQVTRDEAASATGIGRPLAAYHLDRLVAVGLLVAGYQRPGGRSGPGAGRPAKVYSRSGREFSVTLPPREYELAARLLAEAVASDRGGGAMAGLRAAARAMGAQLAAAAGSRSGEARSAQSAWTALRSALEDHQFEPYDDGAGRITLRNCPFHQLVRQNPDVVCGMNLALIEGLAAGLRADELRPVLAPGSGRCCVVVELAGGQDRNSKQPEAS
jgi:predicted ArsR family transcriptional regulator